MERYEWMEILGTGAFGSVYKVWDRNLKRHMAAKVIPLKNLRAEMNYKTELEFLTKKEHSCFPVLYDSFCQLNEDTGVEEGVLMMEYLEGESLQKRLDKAGKLEKEEAVNIAIQLAEILCFLHERKPALLYRDVKPDNIICRKDGKIRLLDFGTVCDAWEENSIQMKIQCGTQGFAAPEVWKRGQKPSVQSDQYAWGAVLLYMLTGISMAKPPYHHQPLRCYDRTMDTKLKWILEVSMAEKPEQRFGSMGECLGQLQKWKQKKRNFHFVMPQHRFDNYRVIQSKWYTEKKFAGLLVSLLLALALFGKISMPVRAMEKKELPVEVYDAQGRKILIKEDTVYTLAGDLFLAIPKDFFKENKFFEITVGSNCRNENGIPEKQEKKFYITYENGK
ncbi:MAG: serine/threonine-protein kinase [Lachnospiraceae bacterium]|nr:serine/threonine-protein kinase [Lachnospiraceae bacterium]